MPPDHWPFADTVPPGLIVPSVRPASANVWALPTGYRPIGSSLAEKAVVAIVPAQDEEETIGQVLTQLDRLPLKEAIVVVNGSSDRTLSLVAKRRCRVIHVKPSLGHDVGRAVGAAATSADIYLFLDADIPIAAEDLMPFLLAVAGGVDVALNDNARTLGIPQLLHSVNIAKNFLNQALGRPDLGTCSLTTVPHALSHRAVEVITPARLAVPPLAHANAVLAGLNVRAVHSVDVTSTNRRRDPRSPTRAARVLERLIIGDHLEALQWVTSHRGPRGGYDDRMRRRDLLSTPPTFDP